MIVSYDSVAARNAEAGLRSTAAQLDQILADLGAAVAQLAAGWEGDEQVLYQDIQRRWDAAAHEIHDILTRITVALGANTDAVTHMRAQVRSVLSR